MAAKRSKQFLALKPQWQKLVAEYLVDHNATRAYQAAGYEGTNPDVHGPRMIGHPDVQAAIQAEIDIVLADLKITPHKILRDLEAARLAAMGAGQFSAAIRAIEQMCKYVNAFPHQYGSLLEEQPAGEDETADAASISDVARGLAFVLAQARRARAKPAKEPVTIQ